MRIALMTDVHGNSIALDAVLADITAQGGADEYWLLGDLVAIGPDPVGVAERLTKLPNARFVRGNTERYVLTGELPELDERKIREDINYLTKFKQVVASFAWTSGAITAAGYRDWLAGFSVEQRAALPDGTRMLGVHASPGLDDGKGIPFNMADAELASLVENTGADLICVGHVHYELDRQAGSVRVLNVASISNPTTPDLRAGYTLIDADKSGYHVTPRRVDYDREAVIAMLVRVHHPATPFIMSYLRGQRIQLRRTPR